MVAHAAAAARTAAAGARRRVALGGAGARRFASGGGAAKGKVAPRVSTRFYEPKSPKVSVPPPPNPPGPFHEVRWGKAAWNGVLISAAGAGLYWAYTKAVVPRVEGLVKGSSADEATAAASAAVPAGSSIVDLRPTAAAAAAAPAAESAPDASASAAAAVADAPTVAAAAAPAPAAAAGGTVSVGADGVAYFTPTRTWWQFFTWQSPQRAPMQETGAGSS